MQPFTIYPYNRDMKRWMHPLLLMVASTFGSALINGDDSLLLRAPHNDVGEIVVYNGKTMVFKMMKGEEPIDQ